MKTTRLEAFSDGVLAITITINGMRESQATRMSPHRPESFTSQITAAPQICGRLESTHWGRSAWIVFF
jgi:hypothetical protein